MKQKTHQTRVLRAEPDATVVYDVIERFHYIHARGRVIGGGNTCDDAWADALHHVHHQELSNAA